MSRQIIRQWSNGLLFFSQRKLVFLRFRRHFLCFARWHCYARFLWVLLTFGRWTDSQNGNRFDAIFLVLAFRLIFAAAVVVFIGFPFFMLHPLVGWRSAQGCVRRWCRTLHLYDDGDQ